MIEANETLVRFVRAGKGGTIRMTWETKLHIGVTLRDGQKGAIVVSEFLRAQEYMHCCIIPQDMMIQRHMSCTSGLPEVTYGRN
jgi:hypothetical protein